MGGYGSGRPGHRPVAEHSHALSIRSFKQPIAALADHGRGAVYEGSIRWRTGAIGRVCAETNYTLARRSAGFVLTLHYCYGDTPITDRIPLEATTPHYGGQRWWFRCVSCGRRCGVLYAPGRLWRCRTCWNVTYTSSNESDPRVSAMLRAGDLHALRAAPDDVLSKASTSDLLLILKMARRIGAF